MCFFRLVLLWLLLVLVVQELLVWVMLATLPRCIRLLRLVVGVVVAGIWLLVRMVVLVVVVARRLLLEHMLVVLLSQTLAKTVELETAQRVTRSCTLAVAVVQVKLVRLPQVPKPVTAVTVLLRP
jgi:hypothetical protein